MSRELTLILIIGAALAAGCHSDPADTTEPDDNNTTSSSNNNTTSTTGDTTQNNALPGALQVLPSSHPRVRFKGGERWANQLARGLDLERGELCKEFGLYDCASDVHFIALGGVEPYRLRINKPLPTAPLTAPIAVERIALSACSVRAERDVANPAAALLFKELSDSPTSDDFAAMGNRLYQRLLSRDAEPEELAAIEAFWTDLATDPDVDLQTEWATYACFAVASSTEMLFY